MAVSPCYLFKNSLEYIPMSDITKTVPAGTRGVYVLYDGSDGSHMNVVYVGMSRGDKFTIGSRLLNHKRNKANLWTHFSLYEVWDNITSAQVEELEVFLGTSSRRMRSPTCWPSKGGLEPWIKSSGSGRMIGFIARQDPGENWEVPPHPRLDVGNLLAPEELFSLRSWPCRE
jgi:hypothetical protein